MHWISCPAYAWYEPTTKVLVKLAAHFAEVVSATDLACCIRSPSSPYKVPLGFFLFFTTFWDRMFCSWMYAFVWYSRRAFKKW